MGGTRARGAVRGGGPPGMATIMVPRLLLRSRVRSGTVPRAGRAAAGKQLSVPYLVGVQRAKAEPLPEVLVRLARGSGSGTAGGYDQVGDGGQRYGGGLVRVGNGQAQDAAVS